MTKKILIIFIIYFFFIGAFLKASADSLFDYANEVKKNNEIKDEQLLDINFSNNPSGGALSLKDALAIAHEKNHHIKSAVSTLPISEAQLIISKYRPNPYISTGFEFVMGGAIHPADLGTVIELGRKRYWRVQAQKEEVSKRELEIAKVIWDVHANVHKAYAELVINQELSELMQMQVDFYEALFEIANRRFKAGDISKLEANLIELELLKVKNKLIKFQGDLRKSKLEFNHALGRLPEEEITLEDTEKLKPKIKLHDHPELKDIIGKALEKRLEIAILVKDFAIANAKLKKAKWERLPNLDISGGSVTTNMNWGGYVGAQVDVPVFNRKQGEIKESNAEIEFLKKEEDRIKHDIRVEVANALEELEVREEQIHSYQEKMLENSHSILEMIRLAYKSGKYSLTESLFAEQESRNVKEEYLDNLLNYQIALADLEHSVGVPLYEFGEEL